MHTFFPKCVNPWCNLYTAICSFFEGRLKEIPAHLTHCHLPLSIVKHRPAKEDSLGGFFKHPFHPLIAERTQDYGDSCWRGRRRGVYRTTESVDGVKVTSRTFQEGHWQKFAKGRGRASDRP